VTSTLIESPSQIRLRRVRRLLPGLLVALLIGALASAVARLVPVLGAPVLALLLGVATRTWAEGRDARARQFVDGSRQADGSPPVDGSPLVDGSQLADRRRQVGAGLQPAVWWPRETPGRMNPGSAGGGRLGDHPDALFAVGWG
jgi:hypothetical protein